VVGSTWVLDAAMPKKTPTAPEAASGAPLRTAEEGLAEGGEGGLRYVSSFRPQAPGKWLPAPSAQF